MNHPENDKWLDEALSETIGSEETRTDFEQWKQDHPQAVEMLTSRARSKASTTKRPLNIRNIIMKSPITKLAAAAVITIGVFTVINVFWETTNNVVLADVLERIEQVKCYRCQMRTTFKSQDVDEKPISQAKVLISQTFGMKTNIEIHNPITGQSMLQEIYVLPPKRTITTLIPNEKKYSKLEFDEVSFEGWQEEYDPVYMVKQILACEHTSLGKSTIYGIEVEGFQTTDPNYMRGSMGQVDVKIWVDVKTNLPVRIEIDKNEENKGHMHIVVYDFQWDVPVDSAEFEPVIPDDYTPGRPMLQILPKKPAVNDEDEELSLIHISEPTRPY